jgi:hypothetical protein
MSTEDGNMPGYTDKKAVQDQDLRRAGFVSKESIDT